MIGRDSAARSGVYDRCAHDLGGSGYEDVVDPTAVGAAGEVMGRAACVVGQRAAQPGRRKRAEYRIVNGRVEVANNEVGQAVFAEPLHELVNARPSTRGGSFVEMG